MSPRTKLADEQWRGLLLDGEEAHRRNSDTFEIPSRAARDTVSCGHHVKLGFLLEEGTGGERMWVRVISKSIGVDGHVSYFGILTNVPVVIDMTKYASDAGYSVCFDPKHILDILRDGKRGARVLS